LKSKGRSLLKDLRPFFAFRELSEQELEVLRLRQDKPVFAQD
jgi:hypothetical protein